MSPEEILRDLDEAKKSAEASQAAINRFIDITTEQILKTITEIYADDLLSMESDGFLQIREEISRQITRLAIETDNIIFNNQI